MRIEFPKRRCVRWGLALLGLLPALVQAASLFGVVTDRAAPAAVEAAQRHLAAHPRDRIVLRTPDQVMNASAAELAGWIEQADSVLAVSTFGDPARRLMDALGRHARPGTPLAAFNGEQALSLMSRSADGDLREVPGEVLRQLAAEAPSADALAMAASQPALGRWLAKRRIWQAGGVDNLSPLFAHLLDGTPLPAPRPEPTLRLRVGGEARAPGETGLPAAPALVVLDLANMESATSDAICAAAGRRALPCVSVLTRWGGASREAVARLTELIAPARPAALVVVQDFVVGAANGREAVTAAFDALDVPVMKAIRLNDRSALQWRLSPDGLPPDSVQYRVALPELQGSGQPIVVSAAGKPRADRLTGVEIRQPEPLAGEIERLVARAANWQRLAARANADKRVAIVYYNHPPGRQNIGADNLDAPASLLEILRAMKLAGYTTGALPASPEALLEMIMASGVNLPEDRAALREMAGRVAGVGAADYRRWFARLPERVRDEMEQGPLGRLHAEVLEAERAGEPALGRKRAQAGLKELLHLAEGADHPRRDDAIALLRQLESGYAECLGDKPARSCSSFGELKTRIVALQIEGLRGWGSAPGYVMVEGDRLLVPGLTFGNVFIGPQPPRGWEVDEELLHANTSVPPPHQYLAFYHWIHEVFKAEAVVHLGRHSTYEFLPGKAVGLTADDYPSLVAGDLPGVYPYIVDGVGEGIQAKRRGLAVMVDHLTPPLAATPLYDKLLELRQVVESYEAANSDSLKLQAARTMREQVVALNLKAELEASMSDVLAVRGIGFEDADSDLLAHEIGHYLTKLQEKFMPHGLHVFGRPWTRASLELMLDSMRKGAPEGKLPEDVARLLADSPRLELAGLLRGLAGGFVPPGKGNDPLRSPEALPTGRNFHAVDGDILPTPLGYRLGRELADKALARKDNSGEGSEAVILWASDAVRDEGVMVGFALALMGAEPVWNARGIVTDVRLLPADGGRARRDVVVTTSGLFRDLYPNLLRLIDRAGRLALAASAGRLVSEQPGLEAAIAAALAPLGDVKRGSEPVNRFSAQWLQRTDMLVKGGLPVDAAGRAAASRVFGDAPGSYGAGVNRLTERSGAWRERSQLGNAYLNRMGHAYGLAAEGEASHAAFDAALSGVTRSYHGRASNLYGLMDNNDAFDYLGGLSLGVEKLTGKRPEAYVLQHSDPRHADVDPLASALLSEMRGRYLNPAWLKPLMDHGYAGARTMGQEFLENLWGWQVTRPDLIRDWAWDEVKAVYFDDRHGIGLDRFLSRGQNAHVKAHMLAVFMVAAEKGFWHTDEATLKRLGGELARLVAKNGLPGSGHTAPDHPMWDWLMPRLDAVDAAALAVTLARARGEAAPAASAMQSPKPPEAAPSPIGAAAAEEATAQPEAARYYELEPEQAPAASAAVVSPAVWLVLALLLPFATGVALGRRGPRVA